MTSRAWDGPAAERAASAVRGRLLPDDAPVAALILGSGLGELATEIADARRVSFADIPGFPATTVAGHAGALIAGSLAGRPVLALAGRFHIYEGHDAALAAFPVRVVRALGARVLFVSNAAGGVRRTFVPGTLMRIADHINLTWRHPLVGPPRAGEPRFPDFSAPYDAALGALLDDVARAEAIPLDVGVYGALTGPSYETPAEVRMLRRLGVDAVGMSTVPEVIVARALGMRVAGVSCISNLASGLGAEPLHHADVLETTERVSARFRALVRAWTAALS